MSNDNGEDVRYVLTAAAEEEAFFACALANVRARGDSCLSMSITSSVDREIMSMTINGHLHRVKAN